VRLRGLRFDQWRDRFGWIIGPLLIVASLAFLVAQHLSAQSPSLLGLCAAAVGLALGGLLFIPASPRVVKALRRLAASRAPRGASGPFHVAAFDVMLPSSAAKDAAILARIWHPATGDPSAARAGATPDPDSALAGAEALRDRRLAEGRQVPILLYAPGGGGLRDDNASTAECLASYGYLVLAIDDVDRDVSAQPLHFDFSSAAAYETTLRRGADKARRQANKALAALDRLEACASPDWRSRLQFERVGFFGFSFGGATAAEAGAIDPRVVAVANLDGWLFGASALGALDKPYMVMLCDIEIPEPRHRQSRNPKTRYEARLTDRDLDEEVRLANEPDGYGFLVRGSFHENLSDQAFGRNLFKSWFVTDPDRIKSIRDAYLTAFFDAHLRGLARPLLRQDPSPYWEVEIIHKNPVWLTRKAAAAKHYAAERELVVALRAGE